MAAAALSAGDHTFVVTTLPVTSGGWTITIVHRHYEGNDVTEERHDSNVVYATEAEALTQGRAIARTLAEQYGR
ncbi:hypothetical protein C7402_102273 [Paraburkholderia unamae]|uniref:Uncharacterized protein n=2 Tax=Paraburkholderia unamae TaxID=219649 RepID=A0ABX5KXE0_9BURK|nr:hypothetical protein C7402_102273 [Paraburkholderia unamae]